MSSTFSITSVFKTLAVVASASTFALPAVAAPTAACEGVIQHAVQLHNYAYPLGLHNTTARYAGKGENMLTGFLEVAAGPQIIIQLNVDTVYATGFFDLSASSYLLTIPDHGVLADGTTPRYWLVQAMDAWTNAVGNPSIRTLPRSGYTFAFVGPNGTTDGLPEDAAVISSSTELLGIIGRVYHNGTDADLTTVGELVKQWVTTPLDLKTNKPGESVRTVLFPSVEDLPKQPTQPPAIVANMTFMDFFSSTSALLCSNPSYSEDAPFLKEHADALGFLPCSSTGSPFADPTAIQNCIPRNWNSIASRYLTLKAAEMSKENDSNGWTLIPNHTADFGTDYDFRAVVAQRGFGSNKAEDGMYPSGQHDSNNATLSSAQGYTVTFAADSLPPVQADVGGFWSLTYYTDETYLADTEKFAVRSADDFVFGEDGSLTIYVQPEAPTDASLKANWLPSAPEDSETFSVTLRLYAPADAALSRASGCRLRLFQLRPSANTDCSTAMTCP